MAGPTVFGWDGGSRRCRTTFAVAIQVRSVLDRQEMTHDKRRQSSIKFNLEKLSTVSSPPKRKNGFLQRFNTLFCVL